MCLTSRLERFRQPGLEQLGLLRHLSLRPLSLPLSLTPSPPTPYHCGLLVFLCGSSGLRCTCSERQPGSHLPSLLISEVLHHFRPNLICPVSHKALLRFKGKGHTLHLLLAGVPRNHLQACFKTPPCPHPTSQH